MAQSIFTRDKQVIYTPNVASGDTVTMNIAVPTDKIIRIRAWIFWSTTEPSAVGHLDQADGQFCEYVVQNRNGTVTAIPASSGNANPINSNTLAAGVSIAAVVTNEGLADTATWGISGTNAQLSAPNRDGDNSNDLAVVFDIMHVGST